MTSRNLPKCTGAIGDNAQHVTEIHNVLTLHHASQSDFINHEVPFLLPERYLQIRGKKKGNNLSLQIKELM